MRRVPEMLPWSAVQMSICVALALWAVASGRWSHSHLISPGALVLAVLGTAPLLGLRRFPACSLLTALVANSAFILFARLAWPIPNVIAWLIALAACPVVLRRGQAIAALVGMEIVILSAAVFVRGINDTPWDATVTEAVVVLLAWLVGARLLERRRARVEQAEVASTLRALQEADAASRGRVGIARELHDVVAHHVSLIAVRAATARYSVPDLSPQAELAFDEIAEQARTALNELRSVLGVLRAPETAPDQRPQPRLSDVPGLVEQVRAAGTQVVLSVCGERDVPDSVQLCGYRIVQEALTNASRYAPGAPVHVDLDYQSDALTVRVRDEGAAAPGRQRDRQQPGSGFGLVGMRERVAMLGGHLRTGPLGPGFIVEAILPLALAPAAAG